MKWKFSLACAVCNNTLLNMQFFLQTLNWFLKYSELQIHSFFGFNEQFDDIGHHGTKVIVFNLWLNDDGEMELDFESDEEVSDVCLVAYCWISNFLLWVAFKVVFLIFWSQDIMISGAPKMLETNSVQKMVNQQHIANRFRYSLRVSSNALLWFVLVSWYMCGVRILLT